MPDLDVKLPLIRGLHAARDAGLTTAPIEYNRAARAAASGLFPAQQGANGRWWVLRSDLGKMVEAIASMPRRRVPASSSALAHAIA